MIFLILPPGRSMMTGGKKPRDWENYRKDAAEFRELFTELKRKRATSCFTASDCSFTVALVRITTNKFMSQITGDFMSGIYRSVTCIVAILALACWAAAEPQVTTGTIDGTVMDQTGAVVPNVVVTLRNLETGVTRTSITDERGNFRAPLLPLGTYEVSAALTGFSPFKQTVLLTVGQTATLNVRLAVAAGTQAVSVTAESPLIESSRTQVSSTVDSLAVANLPVNGRNFIDFVLLTPGVTRDVRTGDISFAGQRGTLNSLVVDGADNNNTFFGQTAGRTGSGRAPFQFSQDAVQEFQVNSNGYSAEFGRAGGAVINVVTKSGTNDLHGSGFWFYRDRSLNANDVINKVAVPVRPRSPYHYNQFGGSVGGPVVRDKGFFFFNYDGQQNTVQN